MKDYIAQAAKIGYQRIFTSMLEVAGNSSATIGRFKETIDNDIDWWCHAHHEISIFENLVVIFHIIVLVIHIIVLVILIIDKDIFKKIAYNGEKGEAYDNKSNRNRYGRNVFNE